MADPNTVEVAPHVTIAGFDLTTIKPYLESDGVKGSLTGIIGAVLGIAVGGGAAALANDVYSTIVAVGVLVSAGASAFGAVRALIGRFKATQRVG